MLNGKKAAIVLLILGLIKKQYKWGEYSPKPKSFGGKLKIELYLCNYATKSDLKNETGVDTSKFAKRFL